MTRDPFGDDIRRRSRQLAAKSALFKAAGALLEAGKLDKAGFDRAIRAHVGRPIMLESPAEIASAVDRWAVEDATRTRAGLDALRRGEAALRATVAKAKAGHEAHRREATPEAPSALPFGGALEFKVIKPDWHGGRAG